MTTKAISANAAVVAILPVTFPPKGANGMRPNKFIMRIKKLQGIGILRVMVIWHVGWVTSTRG